MKIALRLRWVQYILIGTTKTDQHRTKAAVRHFKIKNIDLYCILYTSYLYVGIWKSTLNIHTRRMLNIFMAKKIVGKNNKSFFHPVLEMEFMN